MKRPDPASWEATSLSRLLESASEDGPSDEQVAALARALGLPATPSGPSRPPVTMLTQHAVAPAASVSSRRVVRSVARHIPSAIAVGALLFLAVRWAHRTPAPAAAEASMISLESRTVEVNGGGRTDTRAEPEPVLTANAARMSPAPLDALGTGPPPGVSEAALLLRAHQDLLAGNTASALANTAEHLRRFPRGSLALERELIAIEALARSGRVETARARATTLRQRFPASAYEHRLDAVLGPEATPP